MNAAKKTEISRRILAKVADGMTLPQALDAVLGAGQYDAIVSDLYHALRGET